jgi:hypothetical protein
MHMWRPTFQSSLKRTGIWQASSDSLKLAAHRWSEVQLHIIAVLEASKVAGVLNL